MIELEVTDAVISEECNREMIRLCTEYLDTNAMNWRDDVSQDDMCVAETMLETARRRLCEPVLEALRRDVELAKKAVRSRTAWRVEGTLREFPKFDPVQVWFDYPRHRIDDRGILKDLESEGEAPPWQKASDRAKEKAKRKSANKQQEFEEAVQNCNAGRAPTVNDLVNWYSDAGTKVTDRTIRNWVEKFGFYIDRNDGNAVKKKETQDEE